MSIDIERCADCDGQCDDAYKRAAVEIIFLGDRRTDSIVSDKEHLLDLKLREIAKCALSSEVVITNLRGLTEGITN